MVYRSLITTNISFYTLSDTRFLKGDTMNTTSTSGKATCTTTCLLLVEDNPAFSHYLVTKLDPYYQMHVLATGPEALSFLNQTAEPPGLVLCDIHPTKLVAFAQNIFTANLDDECPFIFFTVKEALSYCHGLLVEANLLHKPFSLQELLEKIKMVNDRFAKKRVVAQQFILKDLKLPLLEIGRLTNSFIEKATIYGLTQTELEIAALWLEGHSNRSIAKTLFLSASALNRYTESLFQKLSVSRKNELVSKLA